jgi:hypothetical protein
MNGLREVGNTLINVYGKKKRVDKSTINVKYMEAFYCKIHKQCRAPRKAPKAWCTTGYGMADKAHAIGNSQRAAACSKKQSRSRWEDMAALAYLAV